MKFTSYIFLFLGLICMSSGNPSNFEEHAVAMRQTQEIGILGNTRKLIEDLMQRLQQSAKQAVDATVLFAQGLQDQAKLFSEKLVNDLKGLRERVTLAINKATDKFTDAGSAVRLCIESERQAADELFSDTAVKSKSCADQRIKDVQDMIRNLLTLSDDATVFPNHVMDEIKKCTELHTGNILATGACMGSVAVRSEVKAALFMSKIGLSITRINVAIATLPASMEICAGSQLVSAGVGTAKLVMDIAGCSASSAFSSLTGNSLQS